MRRNLFRPRPLFPVVLVGGPHDGETSVADLDTVMVEWPLGDGTSAMYRRDGWRLVYVQTLSDDELRPAETSEL